MYIPALVRTPNYTNFSFFFQKKVIFETDLIENIISCSLHLFLGGSKISYSRACLLNLFVLHMYLFDKVSSTG